MLMYINMNGPETKSPNPEATSTIPENLSISFTAASLAFHGLRTRVSQFRATRMEPRIEQLEHRGDLLGELADVAQGVIDEKHPHETGHNIGYEVTQNNPRPPSEKSFLNAKIMMDKRMRNEPTDGKRPLNLSDLPPLKTPKNKQERQIQHDVINDIRKLRHFRKTQASERKMLGAAGVRANTRSNIARFRAKRQDKKDYRSGLIGTVEYQERQLAYKRGSHAIILDPYQNRKRLRKMERTEKSIAKNSQGLADKAIKKAERANKKKTRLETKAQKGRDKITENRDKVEELRKEKERKAKLKDQRNPKKAAARFRNDSAVFGVTVDPPKSKFNMRGNRRQDLKRLETIKRRAKNKSFAI